MRALLALLALTGIVLVAGAPALGDGVTVLAGSGLAQFTHPPGAARQCPDIQAVLEWHPPISNETMLNIRFAGGQGSPVTLCVPGWAISFTPTEVRGQPSGGLSAYRQSADATIWLTLGPPSSAHSHHLHVYQVSAPPLTDIEQFDGDLNLLG